MEPSAFDLFQFVAIPFDAWTTAGIDWLVEHYRDVFQAIKRPIKALLKGLEHGMRATPPTITIAVLALLAWQVAGRGVALVTALAMTFIGLIGAWAPAMTSLAVLVTAVLLAVTFSLPLGILAAKSDRFWRVLRPIVDFMQTIPSFVYLLPAVAFFSIGKPPGILATVIFAMPPMVRLTALGIRQVPESTKEAALAFGASPKQLMMKVELPLALPSIMAGVNQVVMMSLSMVVIAAIIGAGGMGFIVVDALGQTEVGRGLLAGIGIALIAMMIDRVVQKANRMKS